MGSVSSCLVGSLLREFVDRDLPRFDNERELEMHQFARMVIAVSDQEVTEPVTLEGVRTTTVTYYREGRLLGLMIQGHPRRYIQVLSTQFKASSGPPAFGL